MHSQNQPKTMLWWGRFDPGYSRNSLLRDLIRQAGWLLCDFMPLFSPLSSLEAFLRKIAKPDAVWVPAFRQRDFQAARRFADRHDIPVIFDPLISSWDKAVCERKKWAETDPRAIRLLDFEKSLFSRADLLLADTEPHARFFIDRLAASPGKTYVVPVGAEERLFTGQPAHLPATPPEIFFYGSFIGLQGTKTIIDAAIQVPEARWVLLGTGPDRQLCERKSRDCPHIRFEDPLPYEALPGRIGRADVLLGIFGASPKAGRVIPNKVYQSIACGRPVITRQSPAYPAILQNSGDAGIIFVPPEDPVALADAVRTLVADPSRLAEIGRQARCSYESYFSENHIRQALEAVLTAVETGRR